MDFFIEHNRSCIALEVKSGRCTTNSGMSVFAQKFNPKHAFVVGSGGISVEEFFMADLEALLEESRL